MIVGGRLRCLWFLCINDYITKFCLYYNTSCDLHFLLQKFVIMARGIGTKRASAAASSSSSKKTKTIQKNLFDTKKTLQASLEKASKGKCVLLPATDIYRRRVPEGEEEYLFKYHVKSINQDCETAVLAFDESYVLEGGHEFKNYPNLDEDEDTDIDDYSLSQLSQHHKSYNIHIGRYNTIINDRVAADKKATEAEKAKEADTVSDLVEKCNKKEDAYELLRKEFVSVGTLISYTVETGPHQGEINYKQVHEHKHSGYKFTWHHKYGKDTFQKDRIWKAGRYIVSSIYLY